MTIDYESFAAYSEIPILDFKTSVVRVGDIANKQILGKVVNKSYEFPIVNTIQIATLVADDILRSGAFPLADISFKANRMANRLQVGDNFKFSYSKYGIVDKICMVTDIDEGDLSSEVITISCKESIYYLSNKTAINANTVGSVGQTSPILNTPLTVLDFMKIQEAPFLFVGDEIGVFAVASRGTSAMALGYQVFMSTDDGSSYQLLRAASTFAPHGVLSADYPADTYTIDDTIGFEIDSDDVDIGVIGNMPRPKLFTVENMALLGDEIISFQTINPHPTISNRYIISNIRRAQADTEKQEHLSGTDFFFGGSSRGIYVTQSAIIAGAELKFKFVPVGQGAGDLSIATVLSLTIEGRAKKPYKPDNLMSDGIMTNPFYT